MATPPTPFILSAASLPQKNTMKPDSKTRKNKSTHTQDIVHVFAKQIDVFIVICESRDI